MNGFFVVMKVGKPDNRIAANTKEKYAEVGPIRI